MSGWNETPATAWRRRGFQMALLALAATALPAGAQTASEAGATTANKPRVRLTTSVGDIVLELYPDKAPKTVENFLQYVHDKHYDGTIFHRVINNFMVQGGGFDAKYKEKATRAPVPHEGQAAIEKGGPKNVVGTIAMARTNDPQSATAQFFINVKDNAFLDPTPIPPGDPVPKFEYGGRVYENVPRAQLLAAGQLYGYTVFGKVIAGMDVANKIKSVPTGSGGPFPTDVPKTPVTILKATLEK
jgi:peptidyl-prolyl cis-trans isomerase A (cyclophilin A)